MCIPDLSHPDNLEIAVLMRVLNRPIVIVGNRGNVIQNGHEQFQGEPIFVHHNGHNHYNGYLLQPGRDARQVLGTLQVSRRDEVDLLTQGLQSLSIFHRAQQVNTSQPLGEDDAPSLRRSSTAPW